ncbi:MAG: SRPBCC family protein [Planctomycetaceae bacterium]
MNAISEVQQPMSICEQKQHHPAAANVGGVERLVSLAAGAWLAVHGLSRMSLSGVALSLAGAALVQRGWTGHCSVYGLIGMNTAVPRHADVGVRAQHGNKVTQSVTINRDAKSLYDYWRNLENLPKILKHVKSVETIDEKRSRWTALGPGDREFQWEAEIITDRPGEIIAWQSLPGSDVDTAGSVRFQSWDAGKGTELRVSLKYDPPGGFVADKVAHLFRYGLADLLDEDLRRFKQQIETGEIATNALQQRGERQSVEGMTSWTSPRH